MLRVLGATLAPLAFACLSACGTSPTAAQEVALLQVESVDLRVLESFPAQVTAVVHGVLPDACRSVDEVQQQRDGGAIELTITVRRSSEVCVQALQPVEQSVRLTGTFPPGDYVLRVNGLERRFSI
jgi:inhibitor of cysteine peptidase